MMMFQYIYKRKWADPNYCWFRLSRPWKAISMEPIKLLDILQQQSVFWQTMNSLLYIFYVTNNKLAYLVSSTIVSIQVFSRILSLNTSYNAFSPPLKILTNEFCLNICSSLGSVDIMLSEKIFWSSILKNWIS